MLTKTQRQRVPGAWWQLGLRAAGAVLLAVFAGIHLDLYLTGYRTIPTIGWLFLSQAITGFALAAAVMVARSRLAAAAAAGFALATLGGYLLSVWIGLFGFKEVRTTPGITAGVIEVAAFTTLALAALFPALRRQVAEPASPRSRTLARIQARLPNLVPGVAAVSVAALVLLGAGVATADGPPAAAAGASIKRPDGGAQVTYNGHPLYAYVGDSRPGQANGNNLNLNGGRWLEARASP